MRDSHIHVNMNMKMTGWLSDRVRDHVQLVNIFNNLHVFDYMCVCVCVCVCVFVCVSVHMVTLMAGL